MLLLNKLLVPITELCFVELVIVGLATRLKPFYICIVILRSWFWFDVHSPVAIVPEWPNQNLRCHFKLGVLRYGRHCQEVGGTISPGHESSITTASGLIATTVEHENDGNHSLHEHEHDLATGKFYPRHLLGGRGVLKFVFLFFSPFSLPLAIQWRAECPATSKHLYGWRAQDRVFNLPIEEGTQSGITRYWLQKL